MTALEPGGVAVVTGGASGIGLALGRAFAARGMHVVLADIEAGPLDRAAAELGATGIITDVSQRPDVDRLAALTLEQFGRVDVVCNNAGVSIGSLPTWRYDQRDWEWVLGVNLMGVIHGVAAFVPHLVSQGFGHVVNTSSAAGLAVIPGLSPYTVAKHGVTALSEALLLELQQQGVDVGVTIVSPGMVHTAIRGAERNRPSDLVVERDASAKPSAFPDVPDMQDPNDLAADVLAAIEANQLHVAFVGAEPMMQERISRLNASRGEGDPLP